jgi:Beta-ketoacyl synthase, N-terminal domain
MAPQIIAVELASSTDALMPSLSKDQPVNGEPIEVGPIDGDILDSIAIVGFSFQFPGATDSDSLWQMMLDKRCVVKEAPKERMNVGGWYHPDSSRRGQVLSTHHAFKDYL